MPFKVQFPLVLSPLIYNFFDYIDSRDISIRKNVTEDNGGGVYLSAGSSLSISHV